MLGDLRLFNNLLQVNFGANNFTLFKLVVFYPNEIQVQILVTAPKQSRIKQHDTVVTKRSMIYLPIKPFLFPVTINVLKL